MTVSAIPGQSDGARMHQAYTRTGGGLAGGKTLAAQHLDTALTEVVESHGAQHLPVLG